MPFATDGIAGMTATRRTTNQEFRLGTTARASDNTEYIYVKANAAVPAASCTLTPVTFIVTSAAGNFTNEAAFAAGEFGWIKKTAVALA